MDNSTPGLEGYHGIPGPLTVIAHKILKSYYHVGKVKFMYEKKIRKLFHATLQAQGVKKFMKNNAFDQK